MTIAKPRLITLNFFNKLFYSPVLFSLSIVLRNGLNILSILPLFSRNSMHNSVIRIAINEDLKLRIGFKLHNSNPLKTLLLSIVKQIELRKALSAVPDEGGYTPLTPVWLFTLMHAPPIKSEKCPLKYFQTWTRTVVTNTGYVCSCYAVVLKWKCITLIMVHIELVETSALVSCLECCHLQLF